MKLSKLILIFTLCILCLTSCTVEPTYDSGYDDGYTDGYSDGHYEGYEEGYEHGEEWGKESLEYDYRDICTDEIQEAVSILLDYAEHGNDGEYTEKDLERASWAMVFYFSDVCELIGYEP